MDEQDTLNAQIAQRLFRWSSYPCDGRQMWRDSWGNEQSLPMYVSDPAAIVRVWQWVEQQGTPVSQITFDYFGEAVGIECTVHLGYQETSGWGSTWPEALCRAALALVGRR